MTIQCAQCSHAISDAAGRGLPPWCPRCGADIKPAQAEEPEPSRGHEEAAAPPLANGRGPALMSPAAEPDRPNEYDDDRERCPSCRTPFEVDDWTADLVTFCAECGQCLQAPQPWSPAPPDWTVSALGCTTGRAKPKLPGWVGVTMGSVIVAAVWLIPGINVFLQLAGTMLAGALLVEGAGRLAAEARKRQPRQKASTLELPLELPEEARQLGDLRAVYQTTNAWVNSLAILCFGLTFAFGEVLLLDWLRQGPMGAKLILAAVAAPIMAAYLLYRAARTLFERRQLLLFAGGLVSIHRRRLDVHPWERIAGVSHAVVGDAIDEEAVEIKLKYGVPALQFTCCHFPNLHHLWARLQHEFAQRSQPDGEEHATVPDARDR